MITKMKKLTFLVYHKEYSVFLDRLRELGVVHVVEREQGTAENEELQESIRRSNRLKAALKLLQNRKPARQPVASPERGSLSGGAEVLDRVEALQAEQAKLSQQLQTYAKERETLQVWGDFDPDRVARLSRSGYSIGFYTCSERAYRKEWEEKYNALTIALLPPRIFFVTVTKTDEEIDPDAERVKLPDCSLSHLEACHRHTEQAMEENERQWSLLAAEGVSLLQKTIEEVQHKIERSKVILNTRAAAGDKLRWLEGWTPASHRADLEAYLHEARIYYEIADPTPDDQVPIQLNNTGFFSWFEPICRLYMLPKYNELDLTPFFAPFFMLFFGLCLGDSGYGVFLFLLATGYRLSGKSVSRSMKSILSLVQVLAVSTFFCGMLTGTFFGVHVYDIDWPFIQRMKSALYLDNNDMFHLSLILGAVQILFGMMLKAVNRTIQFGFRYALSTIGWIVLLLSMALSALLPDVLPMGSTPHLAVLGSTGILIFFFNTPGKNIFMNIGLGLWDSYNMVTGLLGDILSYVRLFALGLSGGILASVFNSLAVGMSPDHLIAGPIVMVLIFVIGHSINIFMNVLGAMVHPMRLTFVEFFKNSGYEGGGKEYKPFKN